MVQDLFIEKDIEAVGEAENGEMTVRKALKLALDVIIVDLMRPKKDGVAAMAEIHGQLPDTKIAIVAMFAAISLLLFIGQTSFCHLASCERKSTRTLFMSSMLESESHSSAPCAPS